MIDHFTLTVSDLARSRAFYGQVLAPLGYRELMTFEQFVGFGDARKPYFWLKQGAIASQPMHIAFQAKDRKAVDAFHAAALAAGARDDGAPGIRAIYHPHYYGAFVIDAEGHPIEAVCHAPPAAKAKAKGKPARARKPAAKKGAKRRKR
jgi:catechol 2,3-dioxygenase-like lactoylglutathione lyase family enzyme